MDVNKIAHSLIKKITGKDEKNTRSNAEKLFNKLDKQLNKKYGVTLKDVLNEIDDE